MQPRNYQVKELAELSGVSVRTLHHYDRIGLLVPSARTRAGYRLYSEADVLRLQQVLAQRELGLSLEAIRKVLDDPEFDHEAALRAQRQALVERVAHTSQMIRALDRALDMLVTRAQDQGEIAMSTDMKTLFDGFDPAAYEQEVQARWGNSPEYRESQRRTQRYSAQDWECYRAEHDSIMSDMAAAHGAETAVDDARVLEFAERHRLLIDRWFYPCNKSMHACVADLYEADPRFAHNIDKYGAGLTAFLVAAIRANAQS